MRDADEGTVGAHLSADGANPAGEIQNSGGHQGSGGPPAASEVAVPAAHDGAARRRIQRRAVGVLAVAQLLSGLGNGATLAIGSLLAVQYGGSDAWAGAVTTLLTLTAAVAALPLSGLAAARGRRTALVAGLGLAALGALSIVLATMASSLALLLIGGALLGVGSAVNLQSRFAAVDLADAAHRGRDLSLVVWSITVGAVAGPNLIKPGAALGAALHLPGTAGPFLISVTGMVMAGALLWFGLRPDPLLEARKHAAAPTPAWTSRQVVVPTGRQAWRKAFGGGVHAIRTSPGAGLAVAGVVVAHAVMVAVMSMTPLHLQQVTVAPMGAMDHSGHAGQVSTDSFALIGFTISLHIAGMYALSPLMGWLADRLGRRRVLAGGHGILLVSVALAAIGASSPAAVTVALVLLGLGWSAATIAGSALLAESVGEAHRVQAQGVNDTAMGLAGALGGALSGVVMSLVGFPGLALVAGALSVALLVGAMMSRGRPARV
ncbi:MFS transporter [Sinomonas sp. ASV486]|uniref:MFS transporter n=1 Tax=Sinomonas sp. ASV486 TaxID=3051170 RepID=UPI0027DCC12D|nr:MFS transporter [Sinomonas sp. ASV486]MDQ4489606.1 MFS transporter [Sinomonas sp. ASV486]